MTAPPPIHVSAQDLQKLTVRDIKTKLKRGEVSFTSKMRKQALLDLLAASLHLPVNPHSIDLTDTSKSTPKPKKTQGGKANYWRKDLPVRQLLYFELKEGNMPLDANVMGPAEIYFKCYHTPEFSRIAFDELFVERLKSLRQHVLKEEPLLKWNKYHPARALLFDELKDGTITEEMGPAEIWYKYHATPEFKLRGMKFGDTFKRRLEALQKLVVRDKSRAIDDFRELRLALINHPPPTRNHKGEPQEWNGSAAQALLKQDIDSGKHLTMKPRILWTTQPEYGAFQKDTFRWKIQQEMNTRKYLHTLKFDAQQKLRKHGKSVPLE